MGVFSRGRFGRVAAGSVALLALASGAPAPAGSDAATAGAATQVVVRSRHVQANISSGMTAAAIRADVRTVFAQRPTTIVFNEAKDVALRAIRARARERGYGVYIGPGAASQVPVAWRKSVYRRLWTTSTKVSDGIRRVQPDRYVVRVALVHRDTGSRVIVAGTHTIAYGWTTHRDEQWRREVWYRHVDRMADLLHDSRRYADVVLWSGDMNRPASSFPRSLFPQFRFGDDPTQLVASTGTTQQGPATNGRRLRVDYDGAVARSRAVRVTESGTVDLHSDHHAVLARYAWDVG